MTKRLFEDLELSVIDGYQDYLCDFSSDAVAMHAIKREGFAFAVEQVLDWAPAGLEGPNNED